MAKSANDEENVVGNHCPSFFQNSCPGSADAEEGEMARGSRRSAEDVDGPNTSSRKSGGSGGFTCCVPNCFNNSKRNRNISFYAFPNGKSKEKQLLKKRWIHFISRKDFKPTAGHRVCSEHFPGGKKTYMNNVPTVTPKTANAKPSFQRSTLRARNRGTGGPTTGSITEVQDHMEGEEILAGLLSNAEPDMEDFHEEVNKENLDQAEKITQLETENAKLRAENEQLKCENLLLHDKLTKQKRCNAFSVENFKEDDKLFKFYTGLPDYATFNALFKSFGPAVNKLVYHDSGTNPEKLVRLEHNKRGPKRTLTPEQ